MSAKDLFPVFIALVSVVVGGFIAEFRGTLQGARDRRQALRRLLYELLELRHRVARANPEPFLQFGYQIIATRFGPVVSSAIALAEVQSAIKLAIKTGDAAASDSSLVEKYDAAVSALAPFDPVFAYRLRGRAKLSNLERAMDTYYEKVFSSPPFAEVLYEKAMVETISSKSIDIIRKKALDDLNDECIDVARRISRHTMRETKGALVRQGASDKIEMTEFWNKILDQLSPHVLASQLPSSTPTSQQALQAAAESTPSNLRRSVEATGKDVK